MRERVSELEHEIGARQQRGLELKGEIDRHESRIHFNEERLREFATQNTKAMADLTQAEERRRAAGEDLQTVTVNLAGSETALKVHGQRLAARQEALREVEEDLRRQQEALRKAQADAFAAAQDLTRVRNEITSLDLQKQGNVVRLEKLSAEKIQLEEERTRLESRLHEFVANVTAEKLSAQNQRGSVEERQNRLSELQEELAGAGRAQDLVVVHRVPPAIPTIPSHRRGQRDAVADFPAEAPGSGLPGDASMAVPDELAPLRLGHMALVRVAHDPDVRRVHLLHPRDGAPGGNVDAGIAGEL